MSRVFNVEIIFSEPLPVRVAAFILNLCKEFPECFLGYSIRTRTFA